ncbi:MAG: TerB family tellurite resistance protein [Alphaproteobacteria bacterium]|nr:TerB family tellurite resistance protein [Alphaproteobacteria bacterium]
MSGNPASGGISESQFFMWRTLFAVVHADNFVAKEEVRYMAEALEDLPFTEAQRAVLHDDLRTPKDAAAMFAGISDPADQARFFKFARELVWVDGQYVQQERDLITRLEKDHLQKIDLTALVGSVDLSLEDDSPSPKPGVRTIVSRFRDIFSE